IGLNVTVAIGGEYNSSQPTSTLVLWCFIFIVYALAGGLTLNLLEAFYVAVRDSKEDSNNLKGNFNIWDYILAINATISVWALLFSIPLIVIAYFSYHENFIHQIFYDWT